MSALRIASALAAAPDPYAVLQLKRDASAADVKKAFRTAVLLVHPDKAMGCAGAAAAFEAVEAASALLLDAGARREWDAKHKQQSFIERYGSGAAEAGGEAIAPPFSVRLGDVVEAKWSGSSRRWHSASVLAVDATRGTATVDADHRPVHVEQRC